MPFGLLEGNHSYILFNLICTFCCI